MLTYPDTAAVRTTAYNTAASGSDSIITISAQTDGWRVIDFIQFSYDVDPTAGLITITDTTSNTVLSKAHVTKGGIGIASWGENGFICPKDAAVEVKLSNGTAAKHLTVGYR